MFQRNTVLVLGAGASSEAALPVGSELKLTIANMVRFSFKDDNLVSGDFRLIHAFQQHCRRLGKGPNLMEYIHAGRRIAEAMPLDSSIDSFIDKQSGDALIELCGKLAIVQAILDAERKSRLFVDNTKSNKTLNHEKLSNTWYYKFAQLLACDKDQVKDRFGRVAFIIFNYDRTLEHFLFNAPQIYYGIQQKEAAELMQPLKVSHPYGIVGRLPWQDEKGAAAFGDNEPEDLSALAGQIKTFGETSREEETAEMRQVLNQSKIVVFLGFAFHPQNMKIMKPEPPTSIDKVFATGHGISKDDCLLIEDEIQRDFIGSKNTATGIKIRHDLRCPDLFTEYWRHLAIN